VSAMPLATAGRTPELLVPGTPLAILEARESHPLACRWLGRIAFADALALQEQLVAARRAGHSEDTLLLLEHDPVYTTGRGGHAENLAGLGTDEGAAVVRIGRGGDVTYHGPGQLVGYALLDLRARGGDVHRFLRELEAGVIETLAALGVTARGWPGRTGVWVADPVVNPEEMDELHMRQGRVRKIASIGIGVRGGVSMHGFALNLSMDLAPFAAIVPCGLQGVHMTTVARETGRPAPALEAAAALAARHVGGVLARGLRVVPS